MATMLLIRNITHIINYEKHKNEGKYQELLTGTMSHEMLTPLNIIINLSNIVDLKLSKAGEISREFIKMLNTDIE
jgi:signal transduction histidine kinase